MATEQGMFITPEQLQAILTAAIAKAGEMNPMEKRQYAEQIKKEERRDELKAVIRAGVAMEKARTLGCSHSVWPAGHKLAGHACPRGTGEWATGGQVHGVDTIGLICKRCGFSWIFKGDPNEVEYAMNAGLAGFPPPPKERVEQFTKEREERERVAIETAKKFAEAMTA